MAVFDKVLEFFGLKSASVKLPPSSGPQHEDPTNRGQLRSSEREAVAVASSAPSTPDRATEAVDRERRERERLEQRLRESEEQRQRLERERAQTPAAPPADEAPPYDSITGHDQRGGASPGPPEDDRTRNPNAERATGRIPTGVLVAIAGPNVGKVWALGPGSNVVGRHLPGTKIAVPLRDEEQIVSRQHCEVEYTGDRFTIAPFETSSGEQTNTIVNDNALERKTVLRDGATIRIFENVLRFRTLEGSA